MYVCVCVCIYLRAWVRACVRAFVYINNRNIMFYPWFSIFGMRKYIYNLIAYVFNDEIEISLIFDKGLNTV